MKRIFCLIISVISLLTYAQESYMVYNTSEGVGLVRGKSVTPLTRRQVLRASDTIRLDKNARLDIVVTNTARQIITYQQAGTATVYAMVRAARTSANDVSNLTTKNISQSVTNQPTATSVVYGTTMRGQSAEVIDYHTHLAEAIFNAILDIHTNKYKPTKNWTIEKVCQPLSDSLFSLSVLNTGKKNYYFNVVAFSFVDGGRVNFELLYQPSFMQEMARSLCVLSGNRFDMSTYVFETSPNVYYLAFGTEKPFDEEALSFQLHKLFQRPITSGKRIKTPIAISSTLLFP